MKQFVIGVLSRGGHLLAERRKRNKEYAPGCIIFPGGHIEAGELPHDALVREMKEELNIKVLEDRLLGTFAHSNGDSVEVYLVLRWEGEPEAREADELLWITSEEELSPEREFDKRIFRKVRLLEADLQLHNA